MKKGGWGQNPNLNVRIGYNKPQHTNNNTEHKSEKEKEKINEGESLQKDYFTRCPKIPGLIIVADFLSLEEQTKLIVLIDELPWLTELKRRVQQYGYFYDYKTYQISGPAPDIPAFLNPILERLVTEGYFVKKPDQMIINEYQPGQGIAPHIDKTYCFDATVASVSLLSSYLMEFRNNKQPERYDVLLTPGSLVCLKDDARFNWTHGISHRNFDLIDNVSVPRGRRVSLTFRNVINYDLNTPNVH